MFQMEGTCLLARKLRVACGTGSRTGLWSVKKMKATSYWCPQTDKTCFPGIPLLSQQLVESISLLQWEVLYHAVKGCCYTLI